MGEKLDASSAFAGAVLVPIFGAMIIWSGFVLETLWNWFGAPLAGVRLSLAESVGLMCLYGFLAHRFTRTPKPSDEQPSGWVRAAQWAQSPILLLIGYVAHLFMGAR